MNGLYVIGLCMLAVAAVSASEDDYLAMKAQNKEFCMRGTGVKEEYFDQAKAGTDDPMVKGSMWRYTACEMMVWDKSLDPVTGRFIVATMTGGMSDEDAAKLLAIPALCDNPNDPAATYGCYKDETTKYFTWF